LCGDFKDFRLQKSLYHTSHIHALKEKKDILYSTLEVEGVTCKWEKFGNLKISLQILQLFSLVLLQNLEKHILQAY
jgi:hypothetical protein